MIHEKLFPVRFFTPYDCLLKTVAFVILCCVGSLYVTGLLISTKERKLRWNTSLKLYYDKIKKGIVLKNSRGAVENR